MRKGIFHAALVVGVFLVGCGGGTSASHGTSGSGGAPVPLNKTIMVGDAIANNWPWAFQDFGGFVPCQSYAQCLQEIGTECESGCAPGLFQQDAPGKTLAVIFVGTQESAAICKGTEMQPTVGLSGTIQAIQSLYKMQVILATIPPLVNKQGQPICSPAVAAVNAEIQQMATAYSLQVVNLGGALTSPADYNLAGGISVGFYLPSAEGYAAMQAVYEASN